MRFLGVPAELPFQAIFLDDEERNAARSALDQIFQNATDKSDRDHRIHEAVRIHHYRLQEVADHLGLHFSTISVIAKRQAAGIQK